MAKEIIQNRFEQDANSKRKIKFEKTSVAPLNVTLPLMSAGLVERLCKCPSDLSLWWAYLQERAHTSFQLRRAIFERALFHLPGSYKLWFAYLREVTMFVRDRPTEFDDAVETFKRALLYLHKMPMVWLEFIKFLRNAGSITLTRLSCDQALAALPVTQHHLIWKEYMLFVEEHSNVPLIGLTVYPRYIEFKKSAHVDFVAYLLKTGEYGKAMERMSASMSANSRDKWMELCTMMCQHPREAQKSKLEPEEVIRRGLAAFKEDTSRLWCTLADYNIRLGMFERAQDVYEEAMQAVNTVRDFSTIFDAYSQFQEEMLSAKVDLFEEDEGAGESFYQLHFDAEYRINDVDLRLAQLERLIEQRPLMLNAVKLKQNPNNIDEWHIRASLFKNDLFNVVLTYKDAIRQVDPSTASGTAKPFTLWMHLAKVYEENNDIEQARAVHQQGQTRLVKLHDELADIYCASAEMEIRLGEPAKALGTIKSAARKCTRSTKLWGLYADLEENLGTLKTATAVYERMMESKIASAQTVINYANMLEDNKYFEDSFKAYERGLNLFDWPQARDLWLNYLTKFTLRYKQDKITRVRDLFQQALETAPNDMCKPIYLLLAQYEEEWGDPRRVMNAFDSLCTRTPDENDKTELYLVYASKAQELFGVSGVREVFEKAIEGLNDHMHLRTMVLAYADKERKLGEIDRARAIMKHGAQFSDPRTVVSYWKQWNDFEVAHGNQETFREMLRIKRSIGAQFSHTNYTLATEDEPESL